VPYQQDLGRTLTLLLAGVVLLLIIGCANCSILLLARGRTRQHELAIRTAIGASRWRIVRQLLVEAWSSPAPAPSWAWLRRTGLPGFPCCFLRIPFQPNPSSASTLPSSRSLSRSRCSAASSSVLPPHCVSREMIPRARCPAGRLASPLLPQRHRWSVLIAAQVALTLLLMATAGTAIRSFLWLTQMPLGYDPANVMQLGICCTSTIQPSGAAFSRVKRVPRISSRSGRRSHPFPGVSTVAVGIDATPPDAGVQSSFIIDGTGDGEQPQARVMLVGQEYFAALRIPLLQGRVWNADENSRGDFIAVVNRAFATRYLSSSNALGRQLRIPGLTPQNRYQAVSAQSTAWRQIVGVVGDARNDGVDRPSSPPSTFRTPL
jgi:hypothetical protein